MILTTKEIVKELDKYIIGQDEAKRAVAIGLINRERRRLLPPEIQKEITPKNILLVGPSGVGKTEIARRLAQIVDAPFIKVNATQFTEVGYVGRDVDSIIRELTEQSVNRIYQRRIKEVEKRAKRIASQRLLDLLLEQLPKLARARIKKHSTSRSYLSRLLNSRKLEDVMVEIEVEEEPRVQDYFDYWDDLYPEPVERRRRVSVSEARRLLTQEEARKLINSEEMFEIGIKEAEEKGIVFIDEIDKLISPHPEIGRDVSGMEVQRDLLPILDGTTIMTRYGAVRTDHIFFIAAGAFTKNKPSDLIPELQGRFPVVVELRPLSCEDFERILVEPVNSLTKQYQALLSTENVELFFSPDGIKEMARWAELLNQRMENIGARRLHFVIEKVLEDISFNTQEYKGRRVIIDREYVLSRMSTLKEQPDHYIL